MKFDNYPISTALKENLSAIGLKRPTDIQFKAIPSSLNGEDVLAIAQTGTGKTIAFAVPVIQKLMVRDHKRKSIQALIMVPTRELAVQIYDVFESLCANTGIAPLAVFGGVEQDGQIKKLSQGVDVLIATPGRMFDLISQGALNVSQVKVLVLDEADQMLDRGFLNDIQAIKKKLEHRHQTLFFSATINRKIKKLAFSQIKSNAIRIQISPDDPVSKNVSHYVVSVEMDDKRFFLRRFIRDHADSKILVFVRTLVRAERVAKALERGGIDSRTIHREKNQSERLMALSDFREGRTKILVATDVTARGIDIPNVDFVVNYDLPDQHELYVHRVGRTGRGREKGVALSFVSSNERPLLSEIEEFIGKKIEEIPVARDEYSFTVDVLDKTGSIQDMILANEAWEQQRKRKKKGSAKQKKGHTQR